MELNVKVHHEDDGSLWAEVAELPGCFATGDNLDELVKDLTAAVFVYTHDVEGEIDLERVPTPAVTTALRLAV